MPRILLFSLRSKMLSPEPRDRRKDRTLPGDDRLRERQETVLGRDDLDEIGESEPSS
ncbi:hypothetical protein BD414DRAFT_493847 [Trametes punicea]|nr:hypothetical protein BD414DRAFT_493847 [Trametes punicea]